jgi:diguanylate cyclase (GGDEF)-like protein/PAS domain S-box-containing protein
MKSNALHILLIGDNDAVCSYLLRLLQQIQQPPIELQQQNQSCFLNLPPLETAGRWQPPGGNRSQYDLYIIRILPGDRHFLSQISQRQQQHPHIPILTIVDSEASGINTLQFGASTYWQTEQIDLPTLQQFCQSILQQKRDRYRRYAATAETFFQLFDSIPVGIYEADWQTGRLLQSNRKYQQILGYSPAQTSQLTWQSLVPAADLSQKRDCLHRLVTGESNSFCQTQRYLHNQGTYLSVWESVSLIRDTQGLPQSLVFAIHPIPSELESHLQLSQLAANIPGVILQYQSFGDRLEGRFTYVSTGIRNLYEIEPQALLENPNLLNRCIHPQDLPGWRASLHAAIANQSKWSHQWRIIVPSGQIKWVEGITIPRPQANGSCLWDGLLFDISDRKKAEAALTLKEHKFKNLTERSPNIIARFDRQRRYIYVNPAIEAMTGKPQNEHFGKTNFQIGLPVQLATTLDRTIEEVLTAGEEKFIEFDLQTPLGEKQYQAHCFPETNSYSSVTFAMVVLYDMTTLRASFSALQESESRFRAIFEQAAVGIYQVNASGQYIQVNQGFCAIVGYSKDELRQMTFYDLIHSEDAERTLTNFQRLWSGQINSYQMEKRYRVKNGSIRWVNVTVSLVRDAKGIPLYDVGVVEDISDRKQAETRLNYNAFYDYLTGLPNRFLFGDRLQAALDWVQRQQETIFALLLLDLDRFKIINDSLGHQAGDEFLRQISMRLQQCIRGEDTIARLGGDEFAILLWDIDSVTNAIETANRLQACLHQDISIRGYEVSSSASIGITLSRHPLTQTPYARTEDMMRDADIAMYRAKYNRKGSYVVFDGNIHASAISQLQLESELRQALAREQLYLHYQPIISLCDRQLIGFEALVRWHHPQWGIISPGKFIPIAEESGFILPLGEWVMRTACQQMRQWQTCGLVDSNITISVNVSGRQFDRSNFTHQISEILQETQLPGRNLCIEITENVLIANSDEVVLRLNRLRQNGISMSVDDFGTGYSSLGRLHSFPINHLKIDRSFVKEVENRLENQAIIRTIMGLAASLRLKVVVEGVETENQYQYLQNLGCHYGQGYWFGHPLAGEALELWLRDRNC